MVEPRRNPDPGRALALSVVLLLAVSANGAEEVTVEATRREDALAVVCRALLEAPYELVWKTLTDYNRLAEFIPGMRSSRVIEQRGAEAIVEQSGEARFLFISYPIEVTISTVERPPQRDGRILLSWSGTVEAQSMPPLLGEMLMRSSIEDQFRGMVSEIERRDALRRERRRDSGR